jgi:hypothetical protein
MVLKKTAFTLIVVTMGWVCACGGGGPVAGRADPALLVGTWTRFHFDSTTLHDELVFNADGTFSFDEFRDDPSLEDHVRGTYSADSTFIALEGTNLRDGSRRIGAYYYVSAATLLHDCLLREGKGTGIVGTWLGKHTWEALDAGGNVTESLTRKGRFEYRLDRTVMATIDGRVLHGTYAEIAANEFRTTFPQGPDQTVIVTMKLVDDRALGPVAYQK